MKLMIPPMMLMYLMIQPLQIPILCLIMMLMITIIKLPSNLSTLPSSILSLSDSLSSIMILLSMMSTLLIIMSSNDLNKKNKTILPILFILTMTFSMNNMINFYIMFEIVLIPTLILITSSGNQPERLKAAIYLIMYTVTGSLPLLLGVLSLSSHPDFAVFISMNDKINLGMIMLIAFLIKLPMFFTHLWLPKAHVEAPLEGSMILAAILLKLGGYGIIRFMPMISHTMKFMSPWLMSISLIGASITAMNCMRQKDMKSLIAYSSVAHMGLVLASLASLNTLGLTGAIIMMISHGFSSSALFLLVTILYSTYHSRNISLFKGILTIFPNLTFWWFMFMAVNISAPPTMNTISEMLIMSSVINWEPTTIILLFLAALTTASFSILLYVNLSHNLSEMAPAKTSSKKNMISLYAHLLPLILMIMKMETMS